MTGPHPGIWGNTTFVPGGKNLRMGLVERADELSILKQLAAETTRGRGSVAVVGGPIAAGKTALLNVFADHAVEQGAVLLTASGSPAERTTPLGVFSQLLLGGRLGPEARRRATELLVAGRAGTRGDALESEHVQHVSTQVAYDLGSLVFELTDRQPLLIVVDDVHHVDVPSLQCLLLLARRLRWFPAMLVFGETTQAQDVHPLAKAELLRQTHAHRLRLAPLSETGVAEVITEHAGAGAASALAAGFHAVSGGNPLLLRALLEDRAAIPFTTPRNGRDIAVGQAFGQAVLGCLHRADRITRSVASGVAVLGDRPDLALLGELSEAGPQLVEQAVQRLNEAGLLDGVAFRHPAGRAAVLGSLGEADRATLHRKAAGLLLYQGARSTAVAEHLVNDAEAELPGAVTVLQQAADQALLDNRPESAIRYLEHAYRLPSGERTRAGLLGKLANVEWRVNPSAMLGRLPPLTAAMSDGLLDTELTVSLLRHLLWHGHTKEAIEVATLVQDRATGAKALSELGVIRQWLGLWYPHVLARLPAAPVLIPRSRPGEASSDVDVAAAPPRTEPRHRAISVLQAVFTRHTGNEVTAAAEQVLQSTRLGDDTIDPICTALYALIYADRVDKATPWYELLQNEAAARNAPTWEAVLHSVGAEIAFRQGALRTAEAHARAAFDHLTRSSSSVAIGAPLGSLVLALTAMGRYDEAAELIDRPFPESLLHTRYGLHYLYARGQYYLATKALYAALDDFHTCGELMAAWRLDLPALAPWRSAAAEAYLRLGDRAKAEKLAFDQLARSGKRRSRTRGMSLRVVAAVGDVRQRPKLLREAEEDLQASGDRLELARVLTDLSVAQQAINGPSQVRLMVRRAWRIAKDCRAEPLCEQLMPQHAETGEEHAARGPASTERITSLTEAEWRVASLAALGHTNVEISGKLYITVSTVEQHLTRVYKKLKISRRTELPATLHLEVDGPTTVA